MNLVAYYPYTNASIYFSKGEGMIVARLYGGLGNQIFQYATARQLSIRLNTELILDISELSNLSISGTRREFELINLDINARYPGYIESKIIKLYSSRILRSVLQRWPLLLLKDKCIYRYDKKFTEISGSIYLDGYWQSYLYFDRIREVLLSDLKSKYPISEAEKIWNDRIKSTNSVAVHVRRGDYVENSKTAAYHGSCSLFYYENAMRIIIRKVDDPTFFVFSDDLEWAKKNLKFTRQAFFVESSEISFLPHQDLMLMSACKHQVIANSSFSWWGAWLNNNEQKFVIAPKKWIANENIMINDLIPDNWILIESN